MGKKIPKYVKDHMHRIVFHAQRLGEEVIAVEDWLESHGYDIETLRLGGNGVGFGGSGCSLEELEYGNDVVDELCEALESMEV